MPYLAAKTAPTRLGIESNWACMTDKSKSFHAATSLYSILTVIVTEMCWTSSLSAAQGQMFSTGERHGERGCSYNHITYNARMTISKASKQVTCVHLCTAGQEYVPRAAGRRSGIYLKAYHRRLRLQWAHEHRDWQTDWNQVVFSDESLFNLWDHDGRIRVRRYAGERCLPECVIEPHSGLTSGVMVWGVISYRGQSNLLGIEGNLNSNRYVRDVLKPEVVPFLQGIPGAIFQQDNARPNVAKTVRDFSSAQHIQLLP
ncbi:transposable element Tcb1 transposase [Trichonephila clavipes]|nr:transposable element Tcb1 transposase [Trichonephila clavipes]